MRTSTLATLSAPVARSRTGSRSYPRHHTSRSMWRGAVLTSVLMPIPVYLMSVLFDRLQVAPISITLPMFAMLALPAPASLWWMVLCPASDLDDEAIAPIGGRRYSPHAPMAVIPARGAMRV